jgi:glycerophosphoryl diester phosphodiesterase
MSDAASEPHLQRLRTHPTRSLARTGLPRSLLLFAFLSAVGSSGCSDGSIDRQSVSASGGEALHSPFPRPFQIIAHRGASAYAPENTLAAFRKARELGAVEVELDVRLTRDGEVLLFHDGKLERKTSMSGAVRDHTLAELQRVDIGAWFDRKHPEVEERFAGTGLNTLDEVFGAFGKQLFYHVELKPGHPELPRAALAIIDRFDLRSHVIVTSFHPGQLRRVRELAPDLPTCLLISRSERSQAPTETWIDRAAQAGFSQVGIYVRELTAEHVSQAHGLGLLIRAWGGESVADMEHAIRMGANGMTIDWPEKLMRRFLEHAGSPGWRLGE